MNTLAFARSESMPALEPSTRSLERTFAPGQPGGKPVRVQTGTTPFSSAVVSVEPGKPPRAACLVKIREWIYRCFPRFAAFVGVTRARREFYDEHRAVVDKASANSRLDSARLREVRNTLEECEKRLDLALTKVALFKNALAFERHECERLRRSGRALDERVRAWEQVSSDALDALKAFRSGDIQYLDALELAKAANLPLLEDLEQAPAAMTSWSSNDSGIATPLDRSSAGGELLMETGLWNAETLRPVLRHAA